VARARPERLPRARLRVLVLQWPLHAGEVVDGPATVTHATVHDEHRLGHDRSERQPVEGIVHRLIRAQAMLHRGQVLLDRMLEARLAHCLAHRTELVVAAHEGDARRVHRLERKEDYDGL